MSNPLPSALTRGSELRRLAPPWPAGRPAQWRMRLLDLFDRFLLHLEHERRCSLGTIQAYRRDFLQFLAWLDRTLEAERAASIRPKTIRTHELTHLTTDRVRSWQVSLSMERKLATGAIRRKLYALGAFCKFLVGTGAMGAG
jgi:site-specific recombinase XerD